MTVLCPGVALTWGLNRGLNRGSILRVPGIHPKIGPKSGPSVPVLAAGPILRPFPLLLGGLYPYTGFSHNLHSWHFNLFRHLPAKMPLFVRRGQKSYFYALLLPLDSLFPFSGLFVLIPFRIPFRRHFNTLYYIYYTIIPQGLLTVYSLTTTLYHTGYSTTTPPLLHHYSGEPLPHPGTTTPRHYHREALPHTLFFFLF